MESTKFYQKKAEGLKIIRGYLFAIDRVYGDLVKLEDAQPAGDSFEAFSELNTMLDDLRAHVEDHIVAAEAMVEGSRPKPVTASEVRAAYMVNFR